MTTPNQLELAAAYKEMAATLTEEDKAVSAALRQRTRDHSNNE